MTWTIRYLKSARKDFEKIPPQHRQRIRKYLESRIAGHHDPRKLGKPLTGRLSNYWRYRIGPYRVICEFRDEVLVVVVVRVGGRKDVYR